MMKRLIPLFALLLAAIPARATITETQVVTILDQTASVTSQALAYGSNVSNPSLLVTIVRGISTLTGITTTDSIGNTWTKGTFQAFAAHASLQISWANNATSGADTVTITPNATSTLRIAIYEFSGVATSSPLDAQNNTQNGTASPTAATSITPAANNELVIGAVAFDGTATFTAGASFTADGVVPAAANTKLFGERWIQTTATATTAPTTYTLTTGTNAWLEAIAVFKVAAAATGAGVKKRSKLEKIDDQPNR